MEFINHPLMMALSKGHFQKVKYIYLQQWGIVTVDVALSLPDMYISTT